MTSAVSTPPTLDAGARPREGTWRSQLTYRPLLALVALGVAVRVWATAAYFPAVMMSYDTPRFARVDPQEIFSDFWMPAGYPAMLKALHLISDAVWFSITIQHLLGIAAALALFLACRRLGAPGWLACVPAGVVLLSGDHVYLEHLFMADTLLIALACFGLAAAVRGLVPRIDGRWLAAAGALLAAAALTRSVGIVLVVVLLACVAGAADGGLRSRLVPTSAAGAGAASVFGLYAAAFAIAGGPYAGLSDMSGWNLYSRVAPFADCREFTPPAGTRRVCESRPVSQRPGPFGYVWDPNAISRRAYPLDPTGGEPLGEFARAAALHQPGDYAMAVLTDVARYAFPDLGPARGYSGQPRELVSFGFRDAGVERTVTQALDRRYDSVALKVSGADGLAIYQDAARVGGLALLVLAVLSVIGMIRLRGPLRLGVLLFGLAGFGLYLLPTLTVSYDFRYGIPPETFVVTAAALATAGLLSRRREGTPATRAP